MSKYNIIHLTVNQSKVCGQEYEAEKLYSKEKAATYQSKGIILACFESPFSGNYAAFWAHTEMDPTSLSSGNANIRKRSLSQR